MCNSTWGTEWVRRAELMYHSQKKKNSYKNLDIYEVRSVAQLDKA